ncbi:hypothetical protein [Pseudonocardia lacus]|uniref:hypothetical protein n=1 Tax=Pseudonocardia lacus TaxID=2835865 RepID=UPI001BDCC9CF|nr:hypothetical protein [Pseudonocardia lacus]
MATTARPAGRPWPRLLAFLVAGAALVPVAEWAVHAFASTSQTRAVLAESGSERHGEIGRISYSYDSVAVTADGSALDLAAAGGGHALTDLDIGSPVVVTRSAADGRVLQVRAPQGLVDLENGAGAVTLRIGGVLVAAAGLWLGRTAPRAWAAAAVLVPLGALLTVLVLPREHDIGTYPYPVQDAMHNYLDPPTTTPSDPNRSTFRVDEVVPIGARTQTGNGTVVTVTGPVQVGLPGGADPETERWFPTVRVPVHATGALPTNTFLIGEGRGRTVRLDQEPACASEGYACYAVPDGFEARYLVFRNDDVAVDLRSTP